MSKKKKNKQSQQRWVLTVVCLSFGLSLVMSLLTSVFVESAGLFVALVSLIVLVLIGIMQVHNYTLGKTLQTLALTFIAILIIIFLCLLLADLIGQVFNFFRCLYIEIIFRA